jgi:multidrug efflux system membrane fusion protein
VTGGTKLVLASAAVALVAAAAFAYLRFHNGPALMVAPTQPIPVIATTVERRNVPLVLTGLGTVTPLNMATVRSQILGQITSVDFKEGQFVRKGDRLAQIDPRTYQAALGRHCERTVTDDRVQPGRQDRARPRDARSRQQPGRSRLRHSAAQG